MPEKRLPPKRLSPRYRYQLKEETPWYKNSAYFIAGTIAAILLLIKFISSVNGAIVWKDDFQSFVNSLSSTITSNTAEIKSQIQDVKESDSKQNEKIWDAVKDTSNKLDEVKMQQAKMEGEQAAHESDQNQKKK